MRGQQSGVQQSRLRQQSGFNDIPPWQQQLIIKHLQNIRRQKQLQQLNNARQQNAINQLNAISKQTAGGQLPALVNGTPVHDASNYLWPNDHTGGDTKGQALHSMGFVPQQLDQSLYGTPISSTRGRLNQYSNIHGISHDSADMLTQAGGNQVEKPLIQSSVFNNSFQGDQCAVFQDQICMQDGAVASKQEFQGNSLFGHVPVQDLSSGVLSGDFQQLNSIPRNAPVQEFHGRQERAGWSGTLQENAMTPFGLSQGLATLDPTEERILFNTDDSIWDTSIGRSSNMGAGGFGNPLESTDYFNVFPSVQSGSWSALMQSAVAEASSSDTGPHEEWSGLSFQKTELSTENQPTACNDSGKGQTSWVDNNLQSVSSLTSRPFHMFDEVNMSPSGHNVPGFQQSGIKFSYQQSEKVGPDSSHESIQQSPKDGAKWLNRSPQQKPLVEGHHQVQQPMHLNNAPEGAWASQIYEQSEVAAHSADAELNAQNMPGSWAHRQSVSSYGIGSHPCNKPSGWNINEALSSSGNATLKTCENENSVANSQSNRHKRAMHAEREHNSGMWKADGNCTAISFPDSIGGLEQIKSGTGSPQVNTEDSHMNNITAIPNSSNTMSNRQTNQQVPYSHQFDYGFDSCVKYKGDESGGKYEHQLSKVLGVSESSLNNSDRASGETCDKQRDNCFQNETSNDSYNSSQSHHTVTGGGVTDNAWLSVHDSHPLAGANQNSSGQSGRKASGSRKFQYHPMGSLGVNMEPAETVKHVTHSQALSPQVTRGLKGHKKGNPKFGGHVPENSMDMEKGQFADFQGNMNNLIMTRSEEEPSRSIFPGYGSNMPSSFDGSAGFFVPKRTAQTSQNMLELLHKVDQSREQSTVKHFDFSDRNPSFEMSDAYDMSIAHLHTQSTTSQGFGLRLAPPSQRLPVSSHAFSSLNSSQTVNDLNSKLADNEAGEKGQAWLAPSASVQSLPRSHEMSQREHWDNRSSILGQAGCKTSLSNIQGNSSTSLTSAMPYPRNQLQNQQMPGTSGRVAKDPSVNVSFDRLASHFTQTINSHGRAVSDQSAHPSLPGAGGRIMPFNVASPQVFEARAPHQGDLSTMLHNNAWTSQPHKVPPSLFQSVNSLNNNLETTSWASQNQGDQDTEKEGNGSSEFGTHSINSNRCSQWEDQQRKERSWQQIPSEKVELAPQKADASQGQDSVAMQLLDGNFVASGSLLGRPHQQGVDIGRSGKDPVVVPQTQHVSLPHPASSSKDVEAFGHSVKQALNSVETNPSKRAVKRLKRVDCSGDAKPGQQLLYGYNTMFKDAVESELSATGWCSSYSSGDTKMLSFSSEAREDQNANASSQLVRSQGMVTFGRNDSQNQSSPIGIASARTERSQISPQMAPSWFEQYGTFKNGQLLPMYDAQRTAKTASQHFFLESLPSLTSTEHVNAADASQVGSVWQSITTTEVASQHLSPPCSLPPYVTDQSLTVERPKKRKSATSELLPWHKEVTQGSQRLQNMSVPEIDWAQAANRLIEKVEDEAEMIEDVLPTIRPRRRVILTTQLMQQLLPPAPASVLSAEATSNYESVIYFVAKLALGDACSMVSCSGSDSCAPPDDASMTSEKVKTSERIIGDQYISKAVEDSIGRAKKLENDLLRMDKRASILDIRMDCQDLERFSIINRFAKFHGRSHRDGAGTSSFSEVGVSAQKSYPQRYVTAYPMRRNLPEGVQCLSL